MPDPTPPDRRTPELALSPVSLLREVLEGRVDPASLSPHDRRALVALLMDGKLSRHEIAERLKVSPRTVDDDVRRVRRDFGRVVLKRWTPEVLLGDVFLTAERLAAQALRKEDHLGAWSIKRDAVRLAKELGFLDRTSRDSGLRVTIEAIGARADEATERLARALSPELTGEVTGHVLDVAPPLPRPLALPERLPSPPDADPDVEVTAGHDPDVEAR